MDYLEKSERGSASSLASNVYKERFLGFQSLLSTTSGTQSFVPTVLLNEFQKAIFLSAIQECSDKLFLLLHVFPFNETKIYISPINYTSLQDR